MNKKQSKEAGAEKLARQKARARKVEGKVWRQVGRSWLVILTRPCIPAVAGGEQEGGKVVGQQRSPNTIKSLIMINTIKVSSNTLKRTSG